MNKKNYLAISIVGFLTGLLLIPVLSNLKLSFFNLNAATGAVIILVIILLFDFALFVAELISRSIPVFLQVVKFMAVGSLNTFLDLGVLNLLILITAVASGYWYSVFKAMSFIIANVNSYFWNKHWTFSSGKSATAGEFGKFFTVSVIGFAVNVGAASFIVNVIAAPAGFSPAMWANIGAVVATLAALAWNFLGYKFIVFGNVRRENKVKQL